MKINKTIKALGLALFIILVLTVIAIFINLIPLVFGTFYGGLIHLIIGVIALTVLVECVLDD